MKLKIKRLSKDALLPTRKYLEDAGYDLYSPRYFLIPPNGELILPLGIAIEIPEGCFGLIKEKGGIKDLMVGAGIIDSNYRGELKLKLRNFNSKYYLRFHWKEPIAQLLILPCPDFELVEVEKLSETDRGEKGGINKL